MNHLTNLENSVRIYLQDMEDLFSLLEELTVLTTEEPRTIIGPLTYGLDKAAVTELIEKIRVSESTTLILAKQQAESIINEASSKAEVIQQDALKYATRLLSTVQETAEKVSRMTSEANSKISREESPNKIPSNAERSNERIRV